MKIHRSILISSVVVLASRIYEISCGTPASLLKHEESSVSTNLPSIQVSGENVVSARSVSSTEKSANATEKRPEKVNLVEEKQQQTPKNVTARTNKNETQEKARGLFSDKKNMKPKRKSEHLMDSISAEASTSGATLLHDEGGSSSGSSSKEDVPRQTPKPMKIGAGSEQGRKEDGQKKAAIVPAVRSLFEDVTTQNSEGMGNVEKKVRAVMAHMKNLSSGRREALLPYFDRFVTKILKKFETRDDAELEEVEELLDRCLSSRCCNNCCSCQGRRRRRKMKQISHIVNGSRRKSPRSDDDVSDEKSTKKGREVGTSSSGSTSAATTTSLKTTRTTTIAPKPVPTVITTTKSVGPNKEVQAERLSKLRKRLRKRPLVSRRTMEENGTVRKQKCIRQRPTLEQQQQQQQQQQQSDKERTARPSHRSNFDQDDFEIPAGIKTRFNDETSDSFEENDS